MAMPNICNVNLITCTFYNVRNTKTFLHNIKPSYPFNIIFIQLSNYIFSACFLIRTLKISTTEIKAIVHFFSFSMKKNMVHFSININW